MFSAYIELAFAAALLILLILVWRVTAGSAARERAACCADAVDERVLLVVLRVVGVEEEREALGALVMALVDELPARVAPDGLVGAHGHRR